LLDRLDGAHLVGHSYGGAVALRAATRRPAAVASLVVYEPMLMGWLADDAGAWGELAELTLLARDCRELWLHEGTEAAAACFVDYWGGTGTWAAMPAAAQRATAARLPSVIAQFRALLAAPRSTIVPPPVATLLLSGDATRAPARRIADRLSALCPGVRHRSLPGLGHMGPVTHAGLVNRLVLGFLAEQPVLPCHAIA
jgi:pimeloyl-ACP methyl ester carboxylesterase